MLKPYRDGGGRRRLLLKNDCPRDIPLAVRDGCISRQGRDWLGSAQQGSVSALLRAQLCRSVPPLPPTPLQTVHGELHGRRPTQDILVANQFVSYQYVVHGRLYGGRLAKSTEGSTEVSTKGSTKGWGTRGGGGCPKLVTGVWRTRGGGVENILEALFF